MGAGKRKKKRVFFFPLPLPSSPPSSLTPTPLVRLLTRLRRPRFNSALVRPPNTPALQARDLVQLKYLNEGNVNCETHC